MQKITLDGAVMRNKLRGSLAKEIAAMKLSKEGRNSPSDGYALDCLILRARKIDLTTAKGEVL